MSQSTPIKRLGFLEQILSLDTRFWVVNVMELFERLAYYGVRAVIAIYMVLPKELGGPELTHIEKGTIFLWWAGLQSILPMFTGGYADRYGHKKTIVVAIIIKVIGYIMMAQFMSFWGFFTGCMFLATGTAIFKPGVQGTLATTLKGANASMGWGLFYQLVNIGGFLGPVLAGVLRILDWKYVFYSCAIIVTINFLWLPFYKDPSKEFKFDKSMEDFLKVFFTSVLGIFKPRVFFFCLAFSGFWLMFNQVFDLLPNMIDDWVDSSAIIGIIGNAFATPTIPICLAVILALLFGGLCAAIIFLALRPDRRHISEVSWPAYIIVFLVINGVVYLPIQFLNFSGGLAFFLTLAPSLFLTIIFKSIRTSTKWLSIFVFPVGAVGSYIYLKNIFLSNSEQLIRMSEAGQQINPEWLINLNPGLIVFTMVFFGYLTSFFRPMTAILLGMLIATLGSIVAGTAVVGWICIAGIAVFSIGEMLSSPKMLEYLASLAPPEQKGLFMGYSNIPVAIGWMAGSVFAGNRYEAAGDKVNLAKQHLENVLGVSRELIDGLQKSEVIPTLASKLNISALEVQKLLYNTYHPEKIWFDIGIIGLVSIICMLIYDRVINYIEKKALKTK